MPCWKKMVTVGTITRRNMRIVLNSEAIATNWSSVVFNQSISARWGKLASMVRFSNIDWALISKNYKWTSS